MASATTVMQNALRITRHRHRELWDRPCAANLLLAVVFALVAMNAFVTTSETAYAQTLLDNLTTDGVRFNEEVTVALPVPTLTAEGFSKASEQETKELRKRLSGNDDWTRFTRDSAVAPVTIKLEYVTDAGGERIGHKIYSAFVVHTKLASLSEKDLMQQIFGKPETNEATGMKLTELSEADLKAAGVSAEILTQINKQNAPVASGDQVAANATQADGQQHAKTSYSQVEFTLLDKIELKGVLRIERSSTPTSTTIAWILDPKFSSNEKLRGTWKKITDAGQPVPYEGWGGYMNVTRISESPEMLLIESRTVLHELPGWFSGSNFVRSKMPVAIQEGARNMRRKLKAR